MATVRQSVQLSEDESCKHVYTCTHAEPAGDELSCDSRQLQHSGGSLAVLVLHRARAAAAPEKMPSMRVILSPVSLRCFSVAITGSPAPTVACTGADQLD